MSARRIGEHALRAVAVGALALAAWQRLSPVPAAARTAARADERTLEAALARWTAAPAADARVALDTLPDARTRAWLRALGAAGTRVTWRAQRAPALAVAAEPAREPVGGVQLAVAAPDGAPLAARDALGALDSLRAADGGARLVLPSAGAGLRVRTDGGTARLDAPAPVRPGAVLVLARAGWEGKFAVAALEEAGWRVRARFALGPGMTVAQDGAPAGAATTLDTATLAAVVALDSSAAALAGPIAAYVRRGGGLVLAGEAAQLPPLAALAAASLGGPVREGDATLRALTAPRADAVPLAWRPLAGRRALVAAARRVGPGRVVQLADEETWRRRLAGGEQAPDAHRAFWSRAVAAAAHAPTAPIPAAPPASPLDAPAREPAPLAAAVAALGAPTADDGRANPQDRPPAPGPRRLPDALLVGAALGALLAEVASRRLRGAA